MVTAALVALALCVALLGVLCVGLLKSHAAILRQLHQLGDGEPGFEEQFSTRPGVAMPREGGGAGVVDVVGTDPAGDAMSISVVNQRHLTLLAFLSSGCLTCRDFWEAFGSAWSLALPLDLRAVVVTRSAEHEQVALVQELAPSGVPVIMSSAAWDDYEVPVAPYFILVDGASGRAVGEGAAATWRQLSDLLTQAVADEEVLDGIRRRPGRTGVRDRDTDEALLRSGIRPGDPRLFTDPLPPAEGRLPDGDA